MTEIERIVQQLKASFAGGAWHGPAVLEVLKDVDATTAAARPIPGAHSIWVLAVHLAATQAVILRRIRGEAAGLTDNEFWEHMSAPTTDNWKILIQRLTRQQKELETAVAAFPVERLDERLIPAKENSAYENFHGVIQHNAYHAGQIALLKKAARAGGKSA